MTRNTSHEDGNKFSTPTRRKTLKYLGTSAVAFSSIGIIQGASDSNMTIVTKKQGNEIHTTQEVSERWYEYEQRVDQAHKNLMDHYYGHKTVESFGIVPSSKNIAEMAVSQPVIRLDEHASKSLRESIPKKIDGIPIRIGNSRKSEFVCHEGNLGTHYGYKGGLKLSGMGSGTAGYPVSDSSGKLHMLTAAHLLTDYKNGCNNVSDLVYHNDLEIGPVKELHPVTDWAIVSANNTGIEYMYDKIKSSASGDLLQVDSYFTYDGLKYAMSNNYTMVKEGKTTGEETGEIVDVGASDAVNCSDMQGDGVSCSIYTEPGDSGGPIYHTHGYGYATVATNTSIGAKKDYYKSGCTIDHPYRYVVGWPAYKIQEVHDYNIGTGDNTQIIS